MRRLLPLLPLTLLCLLCAAGTAAALTVAPPGLPTLPPPESTETVEEESEAEEECEEAESGEELEECEEEELAPDGPAPPEECVLRTARARLVAYPSQQRVRLAISYTTSSPAEVLVEYRLEDGRGSLNLGEARHRFARKGLLHTGRHLGAGAMDRVRAARGFAVEMTIPTAPDLCDAYSTRHLTIRRATQDQIAWLQSDSAFGG